MNQFSNGRALVVGIARYAHKPLPEAVVNDAHDVAALLSDPALCGYPADQVTLLLDGQATKAAIEHELEQLAKTARADDTVLVFFSGHGGRITTNAGVDGCLVPVDADGTPARMILGEELTAALKKIRAARVVLVMDACHSGATASPKGELDAVEMSLRDADYDRLASGEGRVVIASSKPDEVSYAYKHMRNSVFTDALLKALRGDASVRGDGLVRVLDVFSFVAERVPKIDARQHPYFKGHALDQNFPLALDRGGAKGVERTAATAPRDDQWWKDLENAACALYPQGPTDSEIWRRADGDLAQLRDSQTARGRWFNALRTLRQGGGGRDISADGLIATMLADHPANQDLATLRTRL